MSAPVRPIAEQVAELNALKAGIWAAAMLHLFTSNTTPNKNSVVADFTEANTGGYAAAAVTWGTPFVDPVTGVTLAAASIQFVASGAGPDNSVYGWYLTTGGVGPTLIAANRFPEGPRPYSAVTDAILVIVALPSNVLVEE